MTAVLLLLVGGVFIVVGLGFLVAGVQVHYRNDEADDQAGNID